MRNIGTSICSAMLAAWAPVAFAQTPPATPATGVVGKTINAIGYTVGGGSTKVDLVGTTVNTRARGEAKVQAKQRRY